MNLSDRLDKIEDIIKKGLKDLIETVSQNMKGRIRIIFINGSILDIRYPVENAYSFNLRYKEDVYRIDTAQHHKTLASFPNHFHNKQEENILEDNWTNTSNSYESNVQSICRWVKYIFESM